MKEVVGSSAFKIEYQPPVLDKEIREDVVSYLWEYRFCGQKYNYTLDFSNGQIRDCHRSEPMGIKAKRAIEDREKKGLLTRREEAEAIGIKRLENKLMFSRDNSSIVWASPPGLIEEGYGDYGFVYFGKVKKEGKDKTLEMTAIRVENPSIDDFNSFFKEILDENIDFKNAEDFISSPVIVSEEISEESIEKILNKVFLYQERKGEGEYFSKVKRKLEPLIDQFIRLEGEGKLKAFYALENYAILLKEEHETGFENVLYLRQNNDPTLEQLISIHGHKPPVVRGSCGSTGSIESNNLFNTTSSLDFLENDKYGSRSFTCPNCGMVNVRPENELISCCQYCGSNEVSCSHA